MSNDVEPEVVLRLNQDEAQAVWFALNKARAPVNQNLAFRDTLERIQLRQMKPQMIPDRPFSRGSTPWPYLAK